MATTELLLLEPIENVGAEGDVVTVKAGYARNYLLPRNKALLVTRSNRHFVDSLRNKRLLREQHDLQAAEALAQRLEQIAVVFRVKTGQGGKMFGAITVIDIHQGLLEKGIEIEKRKLHLAEPVKTLGRHVVPVKLHPQVTANFAFEVVSENPIESA